MFGLNTFLALGFQTILTTIVADSAGLALEPRPQVGCKYFLSSLDIFSLVPSVRGFLPGDGVRLPAAGAGWAGQGRGQAGGVAQRPAGHCVDITYNVKCRDPLGSKNNIFGSSRGYFHAISCQSQVIFRGFFHCLVSELSYGDAQIVYFSS